MDNSLERDSNNKIFIGLYIFSHREVKGVFVHQKFHGGIQIGIERLFLHPNYGIRPYDIGLIKLKQSYISNTRDDYYPSPICLPPRNFSINRRYGMMSGWGGEGYSLYIGPVVMNVKDDHTIPYLQYKYVFEIKSCQVCL